MAQLDKFTFVDQSTLIFLFFFILYCLHSRVFIPKIAYSLKVRSKWFDQIIKSNSILVDNSKNFFIINTLFINKLYPFISFNIELINKHILSTISSKYYLPKSKK